MIHGPYNIKQCNIPEDLNLQEAVLVGVNLIINTLWTFLCIHPVKTVKISDFLWDLARLPPKK